MGKGKENAAQKKGKQAAALMLPPPLQPHAGAGKAAPGAKAAPASKAAPAVKPSPKEKPTAKQGRGAFEFAEPVEASEIAALTKKLKPNTAKEPLLRTLKRLAEVLEAAPQEIEQLGSHGSTLSSMLLNLASDASADKDVKLYCIQCITYVLRMYAPETPYDDTELKAVFHLLRWALDRLSQPSLATFPNVLSMLHVTSETKLFLLMLDLDDQQLIDSWVTTLLGVARPDNLEALEVPVQQVVCGLLEDGGSEVVTDNMLMTLVKALAGIMTGGSAAQRLASRVLHRSEEVLRPRAQALLIELVGGSKAGGGALKQHLAPLLVQVHSTAPSVLLPVLPLLKQQLEAPDADTRRAAAALVTSLMIEPEIHSTGQATDLTVVYLQRYMDAAMEVRLQMLETTKQLATEGTAVVQEQAVQQAADRLNDREEKVRLAAVKALSEVASSGKLDLMPQETLERLMARLMDKSPLVRKETAAGLVDVFRAVAGVVASAGSVPDTVPSCLMTIPARLAQGGHRDPQLRSACHTLMFSPGLMPATGPAATPAGAATVWALAWVETDPAGQHALLRLLRTKADLAQGVVTLLAIKRRLKAMAAVTARGGGAGDEAGGEAAAGLQPSSDAELHSLRRRLARHSDDLVEGLLGPQALSDKSDSHQKARASLQSLLEVKDGKVTERLITLCSATTTMAEARVARKDAVERVGSKTPLGNFLQLLTSAVLPTLISPSTFLSLATLALPTTHTAAEEAGSSPAKAKSSVLELQQQQPQILGAAAQLLCSAAKECPSLLITLAPHMAAAALEYATTTAPAAAATEANGSEAAAGGAAAKRRRRDNGGTLATLEPAGVAAAQQGLVKVVDGPRLRVALRVLVSSVRHRHDAEKQGAKLAPLPSGLVPCLRQLALAGPPKEASLAALLVAQLATTQEGDEGASSQDVVAQLASEASAHLTPDDVTRPEGLAAVHTLASVGALAPGLFGGHAPALVDHVIDHLLYSDNPGGVRRPSAPAPASPATAPPHLPQLPPHTRQYLGRAPPQGGTIAAAKGNALRALAKGCTPPPQAGPLPAATHDAVVRLAAVLEELIDIDTDLAEGPGLEAPDDAPAFRLAAARALLRLSSRHDPRLPVSSYVVLALTLQDPIDTVRACFGAKLPAHIGQLQVAAGLASGSTGAWLPSKYAAMLPLAAVDPEADLRGSAALTLRSYVVTKRAAALQQAQRAAMAADGQQASGNTLQALPEFMLPYLIYLLAAHPDCPDVPESASQQQPRGTSEDGGGSTQSQPGLDQEEEEEGEGADQEARIAFEAFTKMLQFLLEPLLLCPSAPGAQHVSQGRGAAGSRGARGAGTTGRGSGGAAAAAAAAAASAQAAVANYPLVAKILHHTKRTEMVEAKADSEDGSGTAHMRTMCDLALSVSAALVSRECDAAGLPAPSLSYDHPATVVLPKNLFDCSTTRAGQTRPKLRLGDHLPPGFQVTLDPGVTQLLGLHVEPAAPPAGRKRKGAKATGRSQQPVRRRRKQAGESEGEEEEEDDEIEGSSQGGDMTSGDEEEGREAGQQQRQGGAQASRLPAQQGKAGDKVAVKARPTRGERAADLAAPEEEEQEQEGEEGDEEMDSGLD